MDNPLFPNQNEPTDDGYVLPPKSDVIPGEQATGGRSAAELIREKLAKIYATEPDAKTEAAEAEVSLHPSKHQQFMHSLSSSGKDLATIQTEWHNYYIALPPEEKRQVWQEFYESNTQASQYGQFVGVVAEQPEEQLAAHKNEVAATPNKTRIKKKVHHKATSGERSAADVREAIRNKVSAGGKLTPKHHLQSLLFGLGLGLVAVVIFLFGFFNEVILAPFIQPSRTAAATPIIIGAGSVAPTATPEVIIPKINVEIPVDYSQTTTDESQIENALNSGVVHYPTTSIPGQNGNTAFFGHSSNNIFNPGKYKFAFVLLHTLVPGDTFYLTKDSKVYVYKVFSKTIVDPSDVGVLDPVAGHSATATLITCDPPGTSLKRLIIVGDQISPDPASNTAASAQTTAATSTATSLPGNGQTLWGRWWQTGIGKLVSTAAIVGLIFVLWRWILAVGRG